MPINQASFVERAASIERLEHILQVFAHDKDLKDPSGYPLAPAEIDAIRTELTNKIAYFENTSVADAQLYVKQVASEPVIADLLSYGFRSWNVEEGDGRFGHALKYKPSSAAIAFFKWFNGEESRIGALAFPEGASQKLIDWVMKSNRASQFGPPSMLVPPSR